MYVHLHMMTKMLSINTESSNVRLTQQILSGLISRNDATGLQVAPVLRTWCDGHPVAVDDGTLLLLLLGRLQAGALLHVADGLVPLPLALGAGPGSGQQGLTHIQRGRCRRRLGWRFGSAVEVIWGHGGTLCQRREGNVEERRCSVWLIEGVTATRRQSPLRL